MRSDCLSSWRQDSKASPAVIAVRALPSSIPCHRISTEVFHEFGTSCQILEASRSTALVSGAFESLASRTGPRGIPGRLNKNTRGGCALPGRVLLLQSVHSMSCVASSANAQTKPRKRAARPWLWDQLHAAAGMAFLQNGSLQHLIRLELLIQVARAPTLTFCVRSKFARCS